MNKKKHEQALYALVGGAILYASASGLNIGIEAARKYFDETPGYSMHTRAELDIQDEIGLVKGAYRKFTLDAYEAKNPSPEAFTYTHVHPEAVLYCVNRPEEPSAAFPPRNECELLSPSQYLISERIR